MIRYTDKNPPRNMGQYLNSYRTRCNGVVIHLFKNVDGNTALVVRVNRALDAKTIAMEVVSLQLGTWSIVGA